MTESTNRRQRTASEENRMTAETRSPDVASPDTIQGCPATHYPSTMKVRKRMLFATPAVPLVELVETAHQHTAAAQHDRETTGLGEASV
jgi:hypothetical protein